MNVIIESKRDQRTLDWLIAQAGPEAVESACAGMGGRRQYVSNIAKALGLNPPESLQRPPRQEVFEHVARLRERIGKPPST